MKAYFTNIRNTIKTLWAGLGLTLKHMYNATHSNKPLGISEENYFEQKDGLTTVQYPHESLPIPDNGRYRLHNEIDDCIVCDKCAKICPVDCIEIDPIKATEIFGKTSDGTAKRIYAAKFDIDMGKCCFCGLCTTVCPTECLTMTKAYDFSEYDISDHTYSFATMTPLEILTKKQELADYETKKMEQQGRGGSGENVMKTKPVVEPKIQGSSGSDKPKFKPKPKPKMNKPAYKKKGDGKDG